MTKTVFVGMSGGVDSSVSAALLKRQGLNVVGVYMKNWTQDLPGYPCPWKEDFQDAKRVAVQLGIKFRVYDFESEYKQKVVDYMIKEYSAGLTPNPDIMCNQEIKFRLFFDTAVSEGADMVATGHYARTKAGQLLTATNASKDQTYFLYRIKQATLLRTLFPLGDFKTKKAVRDIAKNLNLVTATKKDSQGICFVGIREFLAQYIKPNPGPIIDQSGQIVGTHEGAAFYTIGQRHGLNIGGGFPYYVTYKNMTKNELHVTTNIDDDKLWSSVVRLKNTHWINKPPKSGDRLQARLRYGSNLSNVTLNLLSNHWQLNLEQPIKAMSPGQSAVIYEGDRVVGGGIIN
jgi:tRNA-uridine 2-sulfurtransferase